MNVTDVKALAEEAKGAAAAWKKRSVELELLDSRRLDRVTTEELRAISFPAGSMGPKVDAAAEFVEATGKRAAIGSLEQLDAVVAGTAGTNVVSGK